DPECARSRALRPRALLRWLRRWFRRRRSAARSLSAAACRSVMPTFSGRRGARGDERKPWMRYRASMGSTGGHQEMLDRSPVVPEHAALAHPEASALEDDDAACLEGFGGFVDGLLAAGDAEVRVPRAELLDEPIDAALEIASGDRRPHGRGEDRRREHLVQRADPRADETRQDHHVASRL